MKTTTIKRIGLDTHIGNLDRRAPTDGTASPYRFLSRVAAAPAQPREKGVDLELERSPG